VPGSSSGLITRAPGPNGMVTCACSTKSGGSFSLLCMLVDAVTVSMTLLNIDFCLNSQLTIQVKSDDTDITTAIDVHSSVSRRVSVLGQKDSSGSSVASLKEVEASRSRRFGEGRRRSSSTDEYEGKLELLVFCPNSKHQQQHRVLMRDKALKSICLSDKHLFAMLQQDFDYPECSFCFKVQCGVVLATDVESPMGFASSDESQTFAAPLQFYTSPASLHFGIALDGSSPMRSSRSLSPGTHVRMAVLRRFESAPELEHALMYCYLANMNDHAVDVDNTSARVASSHLLQPSGDSIPGVFDGSGVLDIGLSNERFRVKSSALRARGAKISLRQPMHSDLDLSVGVLAVYTTHEVRHFASGSCMLTIGTDGTVVVIPPPPRVERLHLAASVHSVEAVRDQERAHSFCIDSSMYLDPGQDGMVTCIASSSDRIRLGITACCQEDTTLTSAYVVELGPFNPKAPWEQQISSIQRKSLTFHDEQRTKKGTFISYSSGASVSEIACGESFSIAKMSDGSLWSWGTCSHGSLGHGPSVESLPKPRKILCQALRFVSVSCGAHHVGALCSNHELYTWGANNQGQLGQAREKDSSSEKLWSFSKEKDPVISKLMVPTKVALTILGLGAVGIFQVACGDYHTALLTTTGADSAFCICCYFILLIVF
jgi:hypothetical protein